MKIKIILLLILFCVTVNAQDKIVPYYMGEAAWPLHIPLLDTIKHIETSLYKKLRVKEVIQVNPEDSSRIVESINKNGYTVFRSRYWGEKLENQEWTGYNEQNLITAYTERSHFKNDVLQNSDTIYYYYENDLPVKYILAGKNDTILAEAIYEKNIITQIKMKLVSDRYKMSSIDEVVFSGDSIIKRNTVSKIPNLIIVTNGNIVITSNGHDFKKTLYTENYKVVKLEGKDYVTKYFYNENGLTDYSLQIFNGKEKKLIYKYTYYED